jgi:uncharacterized membrane protein YeaQ/YmgE (transglycosylase-associated protein family)
MACAPSLVRAISLDPLGHGARGGRTPRFGVGTWHARDSSRKEPKLMHIIWILLIGLIVGALAKLVMPGKDPGGAIITILLGIAGSFIANYIGRAAGWYAPNESAGLIASVLGAVILLLGYRLITGRRGAVRP